MSLPISYDNGIFLIDSAYVRPRFAAFYMVLGNGRAAFVDTGCNASLPYALAALEAVGLTVADVEYVIATHIHLDHAGGAGLMMQTFPEARFVVHPRGARHMIDPSRLIQSSVEVYGREAFTRLYGEIQPIPSDRVIEAEHESSLDLGGRFLHLLDVPGHAKHHLAVVDEKTGQVFTGDAFGISLVEVEVDGRQFLTPSVTPVQFDPEEMHASFDRLMRHRPEAAYLTHFGQLRDPVAKLGELHQRLDRLVAVALKYKEASPERLPKLRAALADWLLEEIRGFACRLPEEKIWQLFAYDLDLNAQGLSVWLDRQR